jgi:hypothetical protein
MRKAARSPGAIALCEWVGDDSHHAGQERAQTASAQAGTDAMGECGVLNAAQPVVEGQEPDAGLGQLALGPFVAVATAPQRVRRVGPDFEKGRPPLEVGEVEIPLIGDRGLATPGDLGMVGPVVRVGIVDEAAPRLVSAPVRRQPAWMDRGRTQACVGLGFAWPSSLFDLNDLGPHDRRACGPFREGLRL